MKKIIAILLVALMALTAVACEKAVSNPSGAGAAPAADSSAPQPTQNPLKKIAGVWAVEGVELAGSTLPLEQVAKNGLDLVITLNSDGTGTIATPSNPQFTASITFDESSATFEGTKIPFFFDGGSRITLDYDLNGVAFGITLVKIAAEENPMAGMWSVTSIKIAGRSLSMEEIVKSDLYVVAVLNEDGTGVVTSPAYPKLHESVTYTDTAFVYQNVQIPYTFDGSAISFDYEMGGVTCSLILTKK